MKGSADAALKLRLKQLIAVEADKPFEPASLADSAPLFGADSLLQLDSVDALQISMALQMQFGKRVADPKEGRRIMVNINTLADFIQPE